MPEISIRSVRKAYGKNEVVKGVDLEIAAGEFVVILGPSGCGKSTLLRMIAGLEAITSGEICIGGRVVNRLEPRERGCAMVFQNYALYPHMSVEENIGYALKVAGVSRAERHDRVRRTAESVGLGDLLARKPGQLSGGQRQRVAMGRAMIREPKVFLFDEPLSNLDATLRVQMRLEIRRLHQRLGTTSVFVTHDQVEAMTLADRLVVMNAGMIEQAGRPKDVYANPQSLFTGGFIGAPPMNFVAVTIARPGLAVTGNGIAIAYDEQAHQAAAGQKALAGIRPETISITAARRTGSFELPLEFVEELGAGTLYHTRFEETGFVIAASSGTHSAAASLHVQIPPAAVHLFDPASGRRLPPPLAESAARDAA